MFIAGCGLQNNMPTNELKINNQTVEVEVVKNVVDQAKGLSGRASICDNCGMLFEYEDYSIRYFWMKDMEFPLDIIWIKDDTVVGFIEDVQVMDSAGEISRVKSPEAVNKVLEIGSGFSAKVGLKIGEKVEY